MGTLRLGNPKFLHGCIGINLDYLARQAFWERGLDFNHGTGYGVGYLLNVHERPNGFRWKMVPERMENAVLEVGMLTPTRQSIYIEGSHQYPYREPDALPQSRKEHVWRPVHAL